MRAAPKTVVSGVRLHHCEMGRGKGDQQKVLCWGSLTTGKFSSSLAKAESCAC